MEPEQRNRIRSGNAAVKRATRAATEVANAMTSEALEDDKMGHNVAVGQYIEAERDLEGALAIIRDCRRSIEDGEEAKPSLEERMVDALAVMEKTIDDFLIAEVAGTPRDGLPFHRLDECRVLSPDILALVRRRQEDM